MRAARSFSTRSVTSRAIAECRRAGIRVVMITGDYAATARSIAIQAGIDDGEVLSGSDMALLMFGSIIWSDMLLAFGLGVALLLTLEGCKLLMTRARPQIRMA